MKNFLLCLSGLVLGVSLGLLIAWVLAPVEYVDTTPASLRADFKDEYRLQIALAYTVNPDLLRARARLATLGETDPVKSLGAQSQRLMSSQAPMELVQLLADLSTALQTPPTPGNALAAESGSPTPALPIGEASVTPRDSQGLPTLVETSTPFNLSTATPETSPTPTNTPRPTPTLVIFSTLRPTHTPTPTPGAPFQLVNQASFCEPTQPGLLQVFLINRANQPVAGSEVVITWQGGEDHFFTGLKPELGFGYADYQMSAKTEYALSLSAGSTRVTGLSVSNCLDQSGNPYPGGLRLDFKQP